MAKTNQPLIPPEEALWQRYSPHFELPLASATSLFLHGLVIGLLAMGGLAFFFTPNLEATKPPRMDVVMIEGNGSGFEGLSGEAGFPGTPNARWQDRANRAIARSAAGPPRAPAMRPVKDLPLLDLPTIDSGPPVDSELAIELQKIAKEAEDRVQNAPSPASPRRPAAASRKAKASAARAIPRASAAKADRAMARASETKKAMASAAADPADAKPPSKISTPGAGASTSPATPRSTPASSPPSASPSPSPIPNPPASSSSPI